jgi:hypothetical protein
MKLRMKSLVSMILSVSLVFGLVSSRAFAEVTDPAGDAEGYVTVDVEKFTLGQGYLVEPVQVPLYTSDNVASVITRLLGDGNYRNTGSVESAFYLSKIKDDSTDPVNIPAYITENGGPSNTDNNGKSDPDWLGEFDYNSMSGWMYFVNNAAASVGSSDYDPRDGDVIRWQFTVYGFGGDLGSSFMGDPMVRVADKDDLTKALAAVDSSDYKDGFLADNSDVYNHAVQTAGNMEASQTDTDKAADDLTKAYQSFGASAKAKELSVSAKDMSADISKHLVTSVTNPAFGTLGGEWTIFSLARAEYPVPKDYYDIYYGNVENKAKEVGGVLSTSKMTEYSRLILALTSVCKDPRNVAGYDMISPLADYSNVVSQGINGPIYALLALDALNYEIPAVADGGTQNTRDLMIQYILSKEVKKGTDSAGGWTMTGTSPDPDITAMALQALAKYQDQSDVAAAIDRGVAALSSIQTSDGGYASWGTVNSESISQVIVALTELGINPATDPRFVKNDGGWLLSALEQFYVPGQGFKHVLTGSADAMATDQCAYALAAYNRFADGKNSLYNMSDARVVFEGDSTVGDSAQISAPNKISGVVGTKFSINLKISNWPKENVKLLDSVISIPDGLRVDNVTADGVLSGGDLNFGVDSSNTLRLAYADLNGGNEIAADSDDFPGDLIKIDLTVIDDLPVNKELNFILKDFTFKTSAETGYAFQPGENAVTQVAKATAITARFLYSGDGTDLIPENKKAVALEFADFDEPASSIFYKTDIQLFKSPELSNRSGVLTYVALVDRDESLNDLDNVSNYATFEQPEESVNFGDVNADGYINAQDALNTLSSWTRKIGAPNSKATLSMNVDGDACINTSDVLSIVEYYISDTPFAMISK